MGRRSVSVFILSTLVAGFIAVMAPAASAITSVESCFYNSINSERSSRGRARLALKSDLVTIARRHSQRMASDGRIYHNGNLGNEISGNWYAAGENVGMGPTCNSIHDAFMASTGHRNNILDSDYNQIGVGVAYDSDGTIYITEVFAGRRSTTTVAPRPAPRRTTSTVARRATAPRPAARPAAPKPKPKPKPVFKATPMTVEVLVKLVGMDARQVDPATGAAMGV